MSLSRRDSAYLIPGYSLTGDLLAFRRCGLQYRYYNRGALPPSRPVQQWFGEFIHGVLEESYRQWRESGDPLPWTKQRILSIEEDITRRLAARGLRYRNRSLLEISQDRGVFAINVIGPHLFPLIAEAELTIRSVRPMPGPPTRADYYEVRGVVDVLTSVELSSAPRDNLLIRALESDPQIATTLARGRSDPSFAFEVIVDYKGMTRPSIADPFGVDLRWQVLTYAWLRARQPSSLPVISGVLIFINELLPALEETAELKRQVFADPPETDTLPDDADETTLSAWTRRRGRLLLSEDFRLARAIQVVPVTAGAVDRALSEFDSTVTRIEAGVQAESRGNSLEGSWPANPVEQTCAVCDWRSFCPSALARFRGAPTVP